MSDTAEELSERLRNALSAPVRPPSVYKVACDAIDRVRRLERGIERANTEAVPSTEGGWFALADLDKYGEFVDGKCPRETLLQLIEELGNE